MKGTVWYGIHFYPGVAEYQDLGKDAYRVFLNEDTLRAMDPTFAGRPVFVMHVDEVTTSLDELRGEADGWVLESFFNSADGKHWVKFIAVSEKAERAIKQGMKLSNCYVPKAFGGGGLWNGVSYAKEITGGEYEHLAIVPNPRYEESVILSPEQFKSYNEAKTLELKRLANEGNPMKLKFWNRKEVEKIEGLETMSVMLPKSGKERTIIQLVEAEDERLSNSPMAAHPEHLVDMGEGSKMTVNDLVAKHKAMNDEFEAMKKKHENEDEGGEEAGDEGGDADHVLENDDADGDEDEDKKKKAKNAEEAEAKAAKAEKAKNAREKAERLRNAQERQEREERQPAPRLLLSEDRVARGKTRYGS